MLGPTVVVIALAVVAVPLLFALEAAVFALVRLHSMRHPYFDVVNAPMSELLVVGTTRRAVEDRLTLDREHAGTSSSALSRGIVPTEIAQTFADRRTTAWL